MAADASLGLAQGSTARRRVNPAVMLFFLSPMLAELLTGSAPPAEFFNPVLFLVLCALYGSGAVLVRELVVRWNKGWPSILVLGMAYGIVEEGLMVKSFFDPSWPDLGVMSVVGRWGGVNVLWSVALTMFHAVWSISIPILIVEALYPERAGLAWVRNRTLGWLTALLAADVAFGFLLLTPYRPPTLPYLLACAAVAALTAWARRLPASWVSQSPPEPEPAERRAMRAWMTGFAGTLAFFFLTWVLPSTGVPALLNLALIGALAVLALVAFRRVLASARWGTERAVAACAGALTFFVVLAPLQQLDATRPDNTSGMALVGLAGVAFLAWVWKRVTGSRSATALGAEGAPSSP